MAYSPRTTSPSTSNKYYIHTSGGGYNKCIRISGKQCLPNCVGYAYGRFMEAVGKKSCNLPMSNAELWFGTAKARGFKTGSSPKLGAVMCFSKGKVGNSKDGAGHVLIVEKIYSDGSILCSQSGYKSKRFWTTKFTKPFKLSGYKFQGFIYNPDVDTTPVKETYQGALPSKTVKRGSKGADVKKLQAFLNWYGNYKLSVDGDCGSKTVAAVKNFQKENGLTVDGMFGSKSRAKAKTVTK